MPIARRSITPPRISVRLLCGSVSTGGAKVEARKESYVGPWLPEPVVESAAEDADRVEAAESVSLALLVTLESLSPVERAAYLLRRVFDYGYDEIGAILDKSVSNCRQLVHRAEESIRDRRPRFTAGRAEAERITDAFFGCLHQWRSRRPRRLLSADAILYSDGGGKVTAALAPIYGADRIARFFVGITRRAPADLQARRVLVNGQPGRLVVARGPDRECAYARHRRRPHPDLLRDPQSGKAGTRACRVSMPIAAPGCDSRL